VNVSVTQSGFPKALTAGASGFAGNHVGGASLWVRIAVSTVASSQMSAATQGHADVMIPYDVPLVETVE
jgi:hypothetical protein